MKIKNKKDLGLGIFGVLFSAWIVWYSFANLEDSKYAGDPGPRLFPVIGAVIMFLCSLFILIKPDKPTGKKFLTSEQWKSAAIIFGIYILTAVLFWLIGFTATVPIIIFILTYLMSLQSQPDMSTKKRIIKALIFAIIAGVVIYLAYIVGLKARLPKGLIMNLFK